MPTRMPRSKFTGTGGEVQDRAKERALVMEERFPGIRFSRNVPNPLGVKHARSIGVPGAGLPSAVFHYYKTEVPEDTDWQFEAAKIVSVLYGAWLQWRSANGYVSFTALHYATGIDFETIFQVLKWRHQGDPYDFSFGVNSRGDHVYVKFTPAKERLKRMENRP